ncbi:restriction endonuclease subunit S [Clostridium perfringens]|uniref:restriction endonuclease subunit S n=1 Tax=Clostridium perfringens TaxID=1502 RepID=UPI001CCA5435|nr:restriction endonuclease subunit S [Clostridium perfringens]MDK0883905.1 restriction endonuclease subunit S [Clostridium perfringens]UBK78700.1 restriction endonuclease subunit S [Clostridium perfringens]
MSRNVPKLRFKGFEDEWKEKSFKDIFNGFEYGMNSTAVEFDGKNRYIRITDIDDRNSKYKSKNPVSPEGILEDKYLVKSNDILFARTGASVGKTYLYDKEDGKLYFAGFLIRGNVNCENNAKFIFTQTKTLNYEKWVKVMSMRSGQPGINSQEYSSYKIKVPSLQEQEKIANFLSKVDSIIEKQEKKVEYWNSYKKGMMQKIFSQKIRFKDENGRDYPEWKINKIENIATIEMGFTPSTKNDEAWNGNIEWLSIAGMNSKYIYSGNKKISSEILGKRKLVPIDTLIMSFKLTIGRLAIVKKEIVTNEAICQFYWKSKDISNEYMYAYLSVINIESFGCRAAKGITLNTESLNSIVVKLPCLEEQTKIANFLSNIDNIIEKESKKLEELKQWKKGLLQQMFV